NDFAITLAFSAVAFTPEDAPVFERKDRLHRCSNEWIQLILSGLERLRIHAVAKQQKQSPGAAGALDLLKIPTASGSTAESAFAAPAVPDSAAGSGPSLPSPALPAQSPESSARRSPFRSPHPQLKYCSDPACSPESAPVPPGQSRTLPLPKSACSRQ